MKILQGQRRGEYLKALHALLLHFLHVHPLGHLPPLCELKKKLGVGKKFPSVRPIRGMGWGGCTRDLSFENRNKQVCWELPHSQKEERCFPLAGTLHVFCRVLADEAGLRCCRQKKAAFCGWPSSERSRSDRGKGKGLKVSVISSKHTHSE